MFESRVVLDGNQTFQCRWLQPVQFESCVILDENQTKNAGVFGCILFERRVVLDRNPMKWNIGEFVHQFERRVVLDGNQTCVKHWSRIAWFESRVVLDGKSIVINNVFSHAGRQTTHWFEEKINCCPNGNDSQNVWEIVLLDGKEVFTFGAGVVLFESFVVLEDR